MALLVIIGTQYFGGPMPGRLTEQFITDSTDWLTAYFGTTPGDTKH